MQYFILIDKDEEKRRFFLDFRLDPESGPLYHETTLLE